MKDFVSLPEAFEELRSRGYQADFEFENHCFCLYSRDPELTLMPADFHVDEVHRFLAPVSVEKNALLFAITSTCGVRGILIDHYTVNLKPFY
jgi:hypothetical protein